MTTINDQIDQMILSAATNDWQKTALIISKVFDDPAFDKETLTGQNVAERIYALAENGTLSTTGNIRRWRDSNVKLANK
ncbi:MAG: DUF3658 domain-containing protein [Alphaproteobacteria bacterium]